MRVGIVAQKDNGRAAFLAGELRERLTAAAVTVRVDAATAAALDVDEAAVTEEDLSDCDLVVSIGGDGTFLYAARRAGPTPVLGVNLGEVGFLNAVRPDDAVDAVLREVDAFREGEMEVREAPRLAAAGPGWTDDLAMNEVVVQGGRRGHGGGISYEVRVDGSLYSGSHADGVLVATPTGSTAYNLSESGPLLHPGVDGLIVNEMCPSEGMPPLVVDADSEVTVAVSDADRVVVVSDGRSVHEATAPTQVRVATTDPPVRLAGPRSDFFEALGKLD
jgi:NAD+ kinase